MSVITDVISLVSGIFLLILLMSTASMFGKIWRRYSKLKPKNNKVMVYWEMSFFRHFFWLWKIQKPPNDKIIQEALKRERKIWLAVVIVAIIFAISFSL